MIIMLKLRKYLKPYVFWLILAFILLFGQGICDLYLPNLMSDIVNVGISNYGIDHPSPEAISHQAMETLTEFMSAKNSDEVKKEYTLIDSSSKDYDKYCQQYSYLNDKTKSLYVLKKNTTNREKLDDIFSQASLALVLSVQDMAKTMNKNSSDVNLLQINSDDIDLSMLYQVAPYLKDTARSYIEKAEHTDPAISKQIANAFVRLIYQEVGLDISRLQSNYILYIGLYMIGVTLLGVISSILVSLIASRISSGTSRRIRQDLFTKVESFSNAEFDQFSTASLITRTTNDVTQIQNFINMSIRMICYAPILGIGGIILVSTSAMSAIENNANSSSSTAFISIIIGAIIVLFVIMGTIMLAALPKFKILQKLIDKLNLITREHLSGILVIRAFGSEKHEEERFDKANNDLTKVNLFVNRVMTFLIPVMTFVMNCVSIFIVWVGSYIIAEGNLQIGDMMAFIQYSILIIMSFLMIGAMFIIIPRASVSANRIAEVLATEPSVKDPENPKSLPNVINGKICFDNVSFRYNGAEKNALTNISFTAMPGQTTAIIGSTGSGKSTLVNLIPRFYDVTSGKITIDGTDIRELTTHNLREHIGFVQQKSVLFSGDIFSNLRYGKVDAAVDEVKQAAAAAQASSFIEEKPDQYHSPIAQGGANVSGGQKQRLAIARALIKKSEIYIFDDSFSALDFKTDAALRDALKKYIGHSAIIIVAQRINTIMYADHILVLDEGKIVGSGTHNELLRNCTAYREIAISQHLAIEK